MLVQACVGETLMAAGADGEGEVCAGEARAAVDDSGGVEVLLVGGHLRLGAARACIEQLDAGPRCVTVALEEGAEDRGRGGGALG